MDGDGDGQSDNAGHVTIPFRQVQAQGISGLKMARGSTVISHHLPRASRRQHASGDLLQPDLHSVNLDKRLVIRQSKGKVLQAMCMCNCASSERHKLQVGK